jgi:putative glutamine amidotransferase
MTIGISKLTEESGPKYVAWLRSGDPGIKIIDLSKEADPASALQQCDAVLLTGGDDIHPKYYGHEDYLPLCGEIDEERDKLELKLIEESFNQKLPTLAICRGEQMLNVAEGGTLFADIYSQNNIKTVHTKNKETKVDARHEIDIVPGTLLGKIVRTHHGEINSSHHQAVHDVAPDLRVSARATDGTIEALEWKNPEGKPFLLAVQWHPERMESGAPLSENILKHFLFEAEAHAALHKNK